MNDQETASDAQRAKQEQSAALQRIHFGPSGAELATLEDARQLSQAIVASNYFPGVAMVPQAMIKIQFGAELGMPPIASILNIHMIDGKPSMSAAMVAARVKQKGYRYVVLEAGNDGVTIEFLERDVDTRAWLSMGTSSFTMEDAKRAGLSGKKNWQGYPRAMLFARAMTQGARMFTPDVFFGAVYDPEELESITVDMPRGADAAVVTEKLKAPRRSSVEVVAAKLSGSVAGEVVAGSSPSNLAPTVTPSALPDAVISAPVSAAVTNGTTAEATAIIKPDLNADLRLPDGAKAPDSSALPAPALSALSPSDPFLAALLELPGLIDTPAALGVSTKLLATVEAAKTCTTDQVFALRMLARSRYNRGRGKAETEGIGGQGIAALQVALDAIGSMA